MPYLHWECQEKVLKLQEIQEIQGGPDQNNEIDTADETKSLYRKYLDNEHPLHIRRTLD